MLITLSSDYLYVLAMLRTTPLVVTVGISLTIPVAMLGDLFFLGISIKSQVLIGALLVTLSFVVVGVEDMVGQAWDHMAWWVVSIRGTQKAGPLEEARGRSRTPRDSFRPEDSSNIDSFN